MGDKGVGGPAGLGLKRISFRMNWFIQTMNAVGLARPGARIPGGRRHLAEIGHDPELEFDRGLRGVGFGHSGRS